MKIFKNQVSFLVLLFLVRCSRMVGSLFEFQGAQQDKKSGGAAAEKTNDGGESSTYVGNAFRLAPQVSSLSGTLFLGELGYYSALPPSWL